MVNSKAAYTPGRARTLEGRRLVEELDDEVDVELARPADAVVPSPPSFHTVTDCHGLPFLRDLHSNLAIVAVIFCRNDSVAPG
jgi:hypothetical protein